MQPAKQHAFEFTGKGGEYFRIWIVNLLLSIVTLGIYSAWAKVRRLQYFYRNTRLDGASFEYHGTPIAILKGRIIAVVLFLLYSVAGNLNPLLGVAIFALVAVVMPWLIVRSLRFKLYNSSYRGLRFSFDGQTKTAYKVFLLFPILTVFTLYLLAPFTHQRIKQYQHNNSRFGATAFRFDASVGNFYGIYLVALGILLLALVGTLFAMKLHLPFLALLLPLVYLYLIGHFAVNLPNLIWSTTHLGPHTFHSDMQIGKYLWIAFTNLLGVILTLGLFVPFAQIRMARYRFACLGVMAQGELSEFVAGQSLTASATGEETAEMFDIDISL